jgi:hypothetical protein
MMMVSDDLRALVERLLGWTRTRMVDRAIQSIELAMAHRTALVLLGETDLVPIAQALHRRILGPEKPFVVCDRRRRNTPGSVRSPMNHNSAVVALQAARGGSLCVRRKLLPRDFPAMVAQLRTMDDVQLIVCADARDDFHVFLTRPSPIRIPSLITRKKDLPRVVDEYARDAITALGAHKVRFTEADRQWILDHTPLSLSQIEKATLRLVAVRMSRNLSSAAQRLGMAPVSLSNWLGHRRKPPPLLLLPNEPELQASTSATATVESCEFPKELQCNR